MLEIIRNILQIAVAALSIAKLLADRQDVKKKRRRSKSR
jgi:hypothetical protein